MAVTTLFSNAICAVNVGLSSDAKPGTQTGALFVESDTGQIWTYDGSAWIHSNREATIEFVIDGGGSTITTGEKGHVEVPFACTITAVRVFADQSGSIVVDIWRDSYANFPPTDADSITASAPPTLSTAQNSEDATLTGWTTGITAGDILAYNVDSVTTCQRVTVSLTVVKA